MLSKCQTHIENGLIAQRRPLELGHAPKFSPCGSIMLNTPSWEYAMIKFSNGLIVCFLILLNPVSALALTDDDEKKPDQGADTAIAGQRATKHTCILIPETDCSAETPEIELNHAPFYLGSRYPHNGFPLTQLSPPPPPGPDISVEPILAQEPEIPGGFPPLPISADLPMPIVGRMPIGSAWNTPAPQVDGRFKSLARECHYPGQPMEKSTSEPQRRNILWDWCGTK